jgi:CRP/FNR family transcriptional regulator
MPFSNPEISVAAITLSISNSPVFASLDVRDVEAVAEISTIRRFGRGALIYSEGATVSAFYVLQAGLVRISHCDSEGNEQVLGIISPSQSFGEESLLSPVGYVNSARAELACSTIVVPRADFVYLLKHNAALGRAVLNSVGRQFNSLVQALGDRKLQNVLTRVGNWLLGRCACNEQPQRIHLAGSKGLLASELGIASETLSRTLRTLSLNQLLEVRGRCFVVKNPRRLRSFVEHAECRTSGHATSLVA